MTTEKNYWRRFAEWATASRSSFAPRTRAKLAASFVIALFFLLAVINIVLVTTRKHDVIVGLAGHVSDPQEETRVVDKIVADIPKIVPKS